MLKTLKRVAVAAAALVLLAGSALAEPKADKADKAAPPCPKIDFTAADVVRACAAAATAAHQL